jgi:uncharacterized membrane protein YkoI
MAFRSALTALAVLALAAPAAAQFGRKDERIRTAWEAGRISPFSTVISALATEADGPVIEVELEEEDDAPSGWVYEVEILGPEGEIELELDARSGEVVDRDG